MRELTIENMKLVSGAFTPPTNVYPGMPIGIALRTFPGLGYVGAAFSAGYAAGQWLNENTPIQQWISDTLDGDE